MHGRRGPPWSRTPHRSRRPTRLRRRAGRAGSRPARSVARGIEAASSGTSSANVAPASRHSSSNTPRHRQHGGSGIHCSAPRPRWFAPCPRLEVRARAPGTRQPGGGEVDRAGETPRSPRRPRRRWVRGGPKDPQHRPAAPVRAIRVSNQLDTYMCPSRTMGCGGRRGTRIESSLERRIAAMEPRLSAQADRGHPPRGVPRRRPDPSATVLGGGRGEQQRCAAARGGDRVRPRAAALRLAGPRTIFRASTTRADPSRSAFGASRIRPRRWPCWSAMR